MVQMVPLELIELQVLEVQTVPLVQTLLQVVLAVQIAPQDGVDQMVHLAPQLLQTVLQV